MPDAPSRSFEYRRGAECSIAGNSMHGFASVAILNAKQIENITHSDDAQEVMNIRATDDRQRVQLRSAHAFERQMNRLIQMHVWKISRGDDIPQFLGAFAIRYRFLDPR